MGIALNINGAAMKLWKTWNIRFLIIVSLLLQVFLNLTAPQRKHSKVGRKWFFRWPFWLAYLSADWVAVYAIGQILGTLISSSDDSPNNILMFWAPFLLLHLGGPDTITSYTLEDNDFWKRHLLQLVLQVLFTVSIIILQFSLNNKLLLPTILVLFAGITKYAERNIAFYRASFDHLGDGWLDDGKAKSGIGLPIPKQFQDVRKTGTNSDSDSDSDSDLLRTAGKLFGILKRLLVGPLIDNNEENMIEETFANIRKRHGDVLRLMEIELSLLYEVLHTKLPVISSRCVFHFRLANLGCIISALVFFSVVHKDYQLAQFDISLTYGLLIGAIVLDIASMFLLIRRSDWFAICRIKDVQQEAINKRRWSNIVFQSNLITYHVKENPVLLRKALEHFPCIGILFEAIKDFRCESSKNFEDVNGLWSFIVDEVEEIRIDQRKIQEVWLIQKGRILLEPKELNNFRDLDYTRCLLTLHIATELCFQDDIKSNSSESRNARDYRAICKLLSDYMFHLAVTRSALMTAVLDHWESEFKDHLHEIAEVHVAYPNLSSNEGDVSRRLLSHEFGNEAEKFVRLRPIIDLAKKLSTRGAEDRWEVMSQIWVQFMCHAAINCRADIHARQLSQGGELLTLVWLLMNHLGLGLNSLSGLDLDEEGGEEEGEKSMSSSSPLVKNLNSTFHVPHHYHVSIFP